MNTILISYDLWGPENSASYKALIDRIELFPDWCKPLESFWLVKTSLSHESVKDALKPLLDKNDKLVTINITGDATACSGLGEKVSKRIIDNI